jgi:hypothetical protein
MNLSEAWKNDHLNKMIEGDSPLRSQAYCLRSLIEKSNLDVQLVIPLMPPNYVY